MKILILGVNGFIGNAILRQLLNSPIYTVFGMDINDNKISDIPKSKSFHFLEGDIDINNEWIEYHIKKCDVIIPLVAIATPNIYVKNPLKVFHLDFESNLKIVKLVAKYNKRIIFPSTSEVYGVSSDEYFNEYKTNLTTGPINKTRWIYSCSKQLLDRVIYSYGESGSLQYTLFRPFNFIGPKLDSLKQAQLGNGRVFTIFLNNLINDKDIVLVDGGNQRRCFTDLRDGVDAILKIIDNKDESSTNRIFNIGNPENNFKIKKLADKMIECYSKLSGKTYKGKLKVVTQNDYYGEGYEDIPIRVPDITEARTKLGWEPVRNFEDTVEYTMRSFLEKLK